MRKLIFIFTIIAGMATLAVGISAAAQTQSPAATEAVQPATITPAPTPAATPATATATTTATPATTEPTAPAVQASDILTDFEKAINSWKTLGVLAGLIALIQLLMKTLKFGPIDDWFEAQKFKWIKPYIASILGMVLVSLTTYATNGANLLNSVIAGLIVGSGSVGWNELLNKFNAENRTA
jgi:hypothetical protein